MAKELLSLPIITEGDWDDAAFGTDEIYLADPKTKSASLLHSREAYLEKTHADLQFGAHNEAITAIDQAIAVYKDQTGQEALSKVRTALVTCTASHTNRPFRPGDYRFTKSHCTTTTKLRSPHHSSLSTQV